MSIFSTTSFYQFYEHIQQSKHNESVLLEMPMRPIGDKQQYANPNVSPHHKITGTDGNKGRTGKKLVDGGGHLDREITNRDWQQAKEERPELGVYDKANDRTRAEKRAASIESDKLGLNTSREGERTRGGKMIQTNKTTGPEDTEAMTAISRESAIKTVDSIKASIQELAPTVKDYSDTKMIRLIKNLFDATSDTTKFYGEMSEEIAAMNKWAADKLAEDKAKNQERYKDTRSRSQQMRYRR